MSGVPDLSRRYSRFAGKGEAASRGEKPRITMAHNGLRWVSLAALAAALAACSQESARFDYDARGAAGDPRDEARILGDDELRSWRYAARGDLRDHAHARSRRADVTGGLPYDEASPTPASAHAGSPDRERSQLKPLRERRAYTPRPGRRETHMVRSGDTLFSIAQRHDVDVDTLARVNGLRDPSLIRIGDELIIPAPGENRIARREQQRRDAERARRSTLERRYSDARPRRRAPREGLYYDPLLGDREPARGRAEAPRRSAERPRQERERQQRARREDARGQRRERALRDARRQARISSAPARRASAAPRTPPPAPVQRPEGQRPSQIAKAETRQNVQTRRTEREQPAKAPETRKANCGHLMKNPPSRMGANFRRPAHGLIVKRFGPQSDGRRNDGINISVPRGTPVKAAENGVVVYAGDELTGLGKLVLVRHADGWVSAYGHNDEILVRRCDTVKRGQEIARAGVTGNITKPQIHFELRKNARPVDPEQHLAGTS